MLQIFFIWGCFEAVPRMFSYKVEHELQRKNKIGFEEDV